MGKCTSKQSDKPDTIQDTETSTKEAFNEFKILKLIPNYEVNSQAKLMIYNALSPNALFRGLTTADFEILYKDIKLYAIDSNKFLFHQGSIGTLFFIIHTGRVEVIINNLSKGILSREKFFGEMALLSDSKRRASIKTLTHCSLFVLSREQLFASLKKIYSREYDKIREIVSKAKIFSNFSDKQKTEITKKSMLYKFKHNDQILNEGDSGDMLYILKSGSVAFIKNNNIISQLSTPGEIFGEGSLLTGSTRKASVFAIGETEAVLLNKSIICEIFGDDFKEIFLINISLHTLRSDAHFNFFNNTEIFQISNKLKWRVYEKNAIVISNIREHDIKIICSGSLKCENNHKLFSYQVIGLSNALEHMLCKCNYIAAEKTIIGELKASEIQEIFGVSFESLFEKIDKVNFLKETKSLKELPLASIKEIADRMNLVEYAKDTKIFDNADTRPEFLFVVLSGSIEILNKKGKIFKILNKYEVFGESCLSNIFVQTSAKAKEKSEVYKIHQNTFRSLPGIETVIRKLSKGSQSEINFENLYLISELRTSSKRKRNCVKQRSDKNLYDLTVIPLHYLSTASDCFAVVNEKDIYINLDHELIPSLLHCKIDKNNVYFVHQHIQGPLLRELVPVSKNIAKFIILWLFLTVNYLHEKNIAHRNVSTDNIIVDHDWLPYLVDFSCATFCTNRSYSRVSDFFYRSPEMILGKGYTKSTDLWSIGVIMYELLYKCLPFGIKDTDSPIEAYEKILHQKPGISMAQEYNHVNDLISNLLVEDDKRYEFNDIKNCYWINHFNFHGLHIEPNAAAENNQGLGVLLHDNRGLHEIFKSVIAI